MSTDDRSEAALRARAVMLIPDTIVGTDLITVEVSGQEQDLILTMEDAKYLHHKIGCIVGCQDYDLKAWNHRAMLQSALDNLDHYVEAAGEAAHTSPFTVRNLIRAHLKETA